MDRRAELGLSEGVTTPSHKPSRGMAKHIRRLLSQKDKPETASSIAQLDGLRSEREAKERELMSREAYEERQRAEKRIRDRLRYAHERIAEIDGSFFRSRDMTPHQRLELDIEARLLEMFVVPERRQISSFGFLMYIITDPGHEDYLNESVQNKNGLPATRLQALVGKVLTAPEQAEFGRMWNDYHGIKVTPTQFPR